MSQRSAAVTTAGGAQQKTNNRRRINDFITITFHFYRLRVLWRETTRPGEGFLPRGRREAYDHRQNSGLEEESIGVEETGEICKDAGAQEVKAETEQIKI